MTSSSSESRAAILRARALFLAKPIVESSDEALTHRVIIVRVGETEVAIAAHMLHGIVQDFRTTPLRGSASWLAGVAQVHGQLASVVRLDYWLGQRKPIDRPLLAVLTGAKGLLGVLIDEVIEFRDIGETALEAADAPEAAGADFIRVTKDLLTVLDVPRFLDSPEIVLKER